MELNNLLVSTRTQLLLCLLLTSLVNTTQAESSISHEQAQSLMRAVGQIYLREQMTFHLLADCSREFKHLGESAGRAKEAWLKPNTPTIKKSKRIQERVAESIQAQQSDFGAVKFTLDIETLIHNGVTSFRSELANNNRKQRHYLCNRLILSISAGEWDLSQQLHDEVTIISDFEE